MPGTLYVVATPIGNLSDLSQRARTVLAQVDCVAAEDTRVTGVLLQHLGLRRPMLSLREHNEQEMAARIIERLRQGQSVAQVSDAGTPGISDPGARLVQQVRAAGLPLVPVPGPCAAVVAMQAAGLIEGHFAFLGFLPAKHKARCEAIARTAAWPLALVFYESPHRILETLHDLAQELPGRSVLLARELTKRFETIVRLPVAEAAAWLEAQQQVRGEFVLVLDPPAATAPSAQGSVTVEVSTLLAELLPELGVKRAAACVAKLSGLPQRELYDLALSLRAQDEG